MRPRTVRSATYSTANAIFVLHIVLLMFAFVYISCLNYLRLPAPPLHGVKGWGDALFGVDPATLWISEFSLVIVNKIHYLYYFCLVHIQKCSQDYM